VRPSGPRLCEGSVRNLRLRLPRVLFLQGLTSFHPRRAALDTPAGAPQRGRTVDQNAGSEHGPTRVAIT